MKSELLKVEGIPILAESYHVSWGANGVMGVCTKIDTLNKLVELKRPKTGVAFKNLIPWEDLRHTRTQQQRFNKIGKYYPDREHDPRHAKRVKKFKL